MSDLSRPCDPAPPARNRPVANGDRSTLHSTEDAYEKKKKKKKKKKKGKKTKN